MDEADSRSRTTLVLNEPNTNINLYAGKLAAHGSVHLTIVVINGKSPAEGGYCWLRSPCRRPERSEQISLNLYVNDDPNTGSAQFLPNSFTFWSQYMCHATSAGRKAGRKVFLHAKLSIPSNFPSVDWNLTLSMLLFTARQIHHAMS